MTRRQRKIATAKRIRREARDQEYFRFDVPWQRTPATAADIAAALNRMHPEARHVVVDDHTIQITPVRPVYFTVTISTEQT
jgi:hypothetical protein